MTRFVRCDRCELEVKLINQLGNGFPEGWSETTNGDYCPYCSKLFRDANKKFNSVRKPIKN